jgi:undecaprenyl-phosphate 4-deoxy-4-formamido-L-arabinose transferase
LSLVAVFRGLACPDSAAEHGSLASFINHGSAQDMINVAGNLKNQPPGAPAGSHARGRPGATVSLVIPVYNAETTIERLCEELIQELSSAWRLQIILVDDGSADGSAAACQRLHARHRDVVSCLLLSRNFGEHNAVMAGLHYAEGDYAVVLDDDFQNPPGEVRRLLEEIEKGYDVVYVRYVLKRHNYWRNLGSRFHNTVATQALGKPAGLYLSSFKAISRFVVRQAIQYTGPDPYLDAIILRTTHKISVIAAEHQPRAHGRSGYTLGKLFALWGNMIVAFSLYPLRLICAYGLLMAVFGLCYGGYTVVALLVPGWTDPNAFQKLSASMWFFRGSTLLAIGILGEYVGRIYMNLNQSPQFIVRQQFLARPAKTAHRAELGGCQEDDAATGHHQVPLPTGASGELSTR